MIEGEIRPERGDESPDEECRRAVGLASQLLARSVPDPAIYKLVAVENTLSDAEAGPHLWRLTYKRRGLIPEGAGGRIGAGGEIFVRVNLLKREAEITGYGE